MKKLLIAFAAVIAVSFASCVGNTKSSTETDSLSCEACDDSCACDDAPCACAEVDSLGV